LLVERYFRSPPLHGLSLDFGGGCAAGAGAGAMSAPAPGASFCSVAAGAGARAAGFFAQAAAHRRIARPSALIRPW
jgi:hypothetical protein